MYHVHIAVYPHACSYDSKHIWRVSMWLCFHMQISLDRHAEFGCVLLATEQNMIMRYGPAHKFGYVLGLVHRIWLCARASAQSLVMC